MNFIISIDVEAHRVKEEIGLNNGSLIKILDLLKKYNLSATFFIDTAEVNRWGYRYILNTCNIIKKYSSNHQFGLHVHPHHVSKKNKWNLHDYSYLDQEKIINYSLNMYKKIFGHHPLIFRAGGFAINDDTFRILKKYKIPKDSSFLYNHSNCKPKKCWSKSITNLL